MTLILVDGSALVYRAHYAFAARPLTSPTGELTSVCFGFLNSVLRLVETHNPSHLAVAFDRPGKTFRHEMYREYKAQRKPMPDDLAEQVPRLRELLDAWGVPVLETDGWEADDVIGTLARRAGERGEEVWVYSGDKDFLQCVNERVGILKPGRRGDEVTVVDLERVRRQYGLEPPQLVDVFGLWGDTSDNIPGVPGVGEKTALKLIQEFGSLEELYAGLERSTLSPRLKRLLAENHDQVMLSRRLFRIDCDVPVEVDLDELRTVLPTSTEATALLGELGLHRIQGLISRLAELYREAGGGLAAGEIQVVAAEVPPAPPGIPAPAGDDALAARGYVLLEDAAALRRWLADLPAGAPLAVDTETDSLRVDTARLVGVSLAATGLPAAYVPVLVREDAESMAAPETLFPTGREMSRLAELEPVLAPALADPGRLKVGHNLKFDEWILGRHGLCPGGPRFDTMLASYVLDPGRRGHGLDDLALELLGHRMIGYDDLFAAGDRRRDILTVPLPRLALYAAEDADMTLRLHDLLGPRLVDAGLQRLFAEVEMPLLAVLLRMERHGIRIDRDFLAELGGSFAAEMNRLERRIYAAAGCEFNVQSPKQIREILFDKLCLKPLKKTATGWSTDASVLERLTDQHELPGLILEHRELAKLQSTYVETLPTLADRNTGLIHTSFNQAVAATGRLSSSDPNLQNIPVRTDLGRQIRRAFVPRAPENVFLAADYSQVELRLLAHLSGDQALRTAFREDVDVHRRTAALIAGVDEQDVTAEMRSRAKAINFGVIYGMGARALARQISVNQSVAKEFIETYFATYPGVSRFIAETRDRARAQGHVETLLGRRRLLPEINSANDRVRAFQERIAVNTPIQGTAADLVKVAMIRLDGELQRRHLGALMLLQVHDELVLEVPRAELDEVSALVREIMEGALELAVPLRVDLHTGSNWAEAHG
ncbi:MAG: DNA polymerase I [Candidatus Krumholzibacteriia bacterium]